MSESRPNVIVVSGPSGAGKSTLLAKIVETRSGLRFSVSHTTRAMRPGEVEGIDYRFVDRAGFEKLVAQGRFLEYAEVHGHLYGTSAAEYELAAQEEKDVLLDLDVQGARSLRKRLPDVVTVFVLPPSHKDLVHRIRGRAQDNESVIARRLEAAEDEMRWYSEYDFVLVNDDLSKCTQSLSAIVEASRFKTIRMESEAQRVLDTFPKRRR